jgi:hypothetical protein
MQTSQIAQPEPNSYWLSPNPCGGRLTPAEDCRSGSDEVGILTVGNLGVDFGT